nr:hypothetical protein CFP56_04599 [Quercus suber]
MRRSSGVCERRSSPSARAGASQVREAIYIYPPHLCPRATRGADVVSSLQAYTSSCSKRKKSSAAPPDAGRCVWTPPCRTVPRGRASSHGFDDQILLFGHAFGPATHPSGLECGPRRRSSTTSSPYTTASEANHTYIPRSTPGASNPDASAPARLIPNVAIRPVTLRSIF